MQFQFSFKHMDSTDALRRYAENKLRQCIEKLHGNAIEVQVTFQVDGDRHSGTCLVLGRKGDKFQVEHTSQDMYASVDRMLDKLATQLKKNRDRQTKGHRRKFRVQEYKQNPELIDYETAEIDAEDIIKYEQARRRATGS